MNEVSCIQFQMEIDWYTHHLNDGGGGGCSSGINGSGSHMFEISSIVQKLWHNLCIEFPSELISIVCIKENFISN